jgi:hypothetical protein
VLVDLVGRQTPRNLGGIQPVSSRTLRTPGSSPRRRPSHPSREGIPVRWAAIAAIVIVWNLLFLLDGFVPWNPPKPPGLFVLLALRFCSQGRLV